MAGSSDEWADKAKRYLRAEMVRAGVKNAELAKRLTDMGLPETEAGIQVKINRGAFPAWFLFAAMHALGAQLIRFE
jgi:urease accessory protein UreF